MLQLYHDLFAIPTARGGDHVSPKCKSHVSRAAALRVLSLLSRDARNLRALLDKLNAHHSGALRRFSTWEYHPGTDDKVRDAIYSSLVSNTHTSLFTATVALPISVLRVT